MKNSIIKRFTELKHDKNSGGKWKSHDDKMPDGWPTEDINEIEDLLVAMKSSSSSLAKKISGLIPSQLSDPTLASSIQSIMNINPTDSTSSQIIDDSITHDSLCVDVREADLTKVIKRMPERILAQTFLDCSSRMHGIQPINEHLYAYCGQVSSKLASSRMTYSLKLEENVISPLQRIKEASSSSGPLDSSKANLLRVIHAMRGLNERINRASIAQKNSTEVIANESIAQFHSSEPIIEISSSSPLAQAKLDTKSHPGHSSCRPLSSHESLKGSHPTLSDSGNSSSSTVMGLYSNSRLMNNGNMVEERKNKTENLIQMREELESELVSAKETALQEFFKYEANTFEMNMEAMLQLVNLSYDYHQSCAEVLSNLKNHLHKNIASKKILPIYGRSLKDHVETYNSRIAYPLHLCISVLESTNCLSEEGLFRIAGSKKKVDTLTSAINVLRGEAIIGQYDSFVIADTMKQYLRSLPEPLLTGSYRDEWLKLINSKVDPTIDAIRLAVDKLGEPEMYNLLYLLLFLNRYSMNEMNNKMSTYNLAIIFAPTLLPRVIINTTTTMAGQSPQEQQDTNHTNLNRAATIIERMIINYRKIFPLSAIRELENYPRIDFISEKRSEELFDSDLCSSMYQKATPTKDAKSDTMSSDLCQPFSPTSLKRHSTSDNMTRGLVNFFKTLPSRKTIVQSSVPKLSKRIDCIVNASTKTGAKSVNYGSGGKANVDYSGAIGRRKLLLIKSLSQVSSPSRCHCNFIDSICHSNDEISPYEKELIYDVYSTNRRGQRLIEKQNYLNGTTPEQLDVLESEENRAKSCTPGDNEYTNGARALSKSRGKLLNASKKSIHSDVYDTMFALQSLNGIPKDFLSKVRPENNYISVEGNIT